MCIIETVYPTYNFLKANLLSLFCVERVMKTEVSGLLKNQFDNQWQSEATTLSVLELFLFLESADTQGPIVKLLLKHSHLFLVTYISQFNKFFPYCCHLNQDAPLVSTCNHLERSSQLWLQLSTTFKADQLAFLKLHYLEI